MQSTQIRLARRPEGAPSEETFETAVADLPDVGDGEVLLAVRYLSLDPYMRGRLSTAKSYAAPVEVGDVMVGGTVAEVVESRYEGLEPGDTVLSYSGWQTHAVAPGRAVRPLDPTAAPVSTALGVLGMPGFTAYAGLLQIGRPQPGRPWSWPLPPDPGSAVGQIARIERARAVGIAGGPAKVAALTEEFGFDAAVDHRAPDFAEQLAAAVPDGIDVYFENVGGAVWDAVRSHLNPHARIPVCGLVAGYNDAGPPAGPDRMPGLMRQVLTSSLTVRGFIQDEFVKEHYQDFQSEMGEWIRTGVVRYREDVVDGLENAPSAFAGMLRGDNFGKLVVRVS